MPQVEAPEVDEKRSRAGIALLRTICLVMGSIWFALLLGEGLLRLMPWLLSVELQQQLQGDLSDVGPRHPYIGGLAKPYDHDTIVGRDFSAPYHTDGNGFRNAWPWPEQADIVVVGDSFVFGYGVQDTEAWPALLSQALPQARVINLGFIGTGPQQYLRIYETFGTPLHPKVIVVGLLLINDFWDAATFEKWVNAHTTEHYIAWRSRRNRFTLRHPILSINNLLLRYSYIYNLGYSAYKAKSKGGTVRLELADGGKLQLVPSLLEYATSLGQPDRREFRLVLKALVDFQALARQQGAHLLVVFQPSKEEVYLPFLETTVADLSAPLRAALDANGIAYLDLTATFRQCARAGKRLFFEVDGHPNTQGLQLIAQDVLAYLSKHAAVYTVPSAASSASSTQMQCNEH